MRGVPSALMIFAIVVVGLVRPILAERFHQVQLTSDVYPLPSPTALVVGSLGHRSALADAIFAHIVVSYGIHLQERRRLEFAGLYLDAINELDPKFRDPYRYADTFLVVGPDLPPQENYLKARQVFERGLKERPYDTELWLTVGQYVLYLGGPHMLTDEVKKEWRIAGARILGRACELASSNHKVPYHCIAAASLLEKAGEREAAIQSLQRTLAVTDDPEIERIALNYLSAKLSDRERERQERRRDVFRKAWKSDLPFETKDAMLVLGPKTDVRKCAGRTALTYLPDDVQCVTSWATWATIADPAPTD